MFSCKIHGAGEKIAAIADSDLVGRTIKGMIDIEITAEFYGNGSMGADEVLLLIRGSTIKNAIGRMSVKLLVDRGLADPEAVLEIGGIPHAQVVYTGKI